MCLENHLGYRKVEMLVKHDLFLTSFMMYHLNNKVLYIAYGGNERDKRYLVIHGKKKLTHLSGKQLLDFNNHKDLCENSIYGKIFDNNSN